MLGSTLTGPSEDLSIPESDKVFFLQALSLCSLLFINRLCIHREICTTHREENKVNQTVTTINVRPNSHNINVQPNSHHTVNHTMTPGFQSKQKRGVQPSVNTEMGSHFSPGGRRRHVDVEVGSESRWLSRSPHRCHQLWVCAARLSALSLSSTGKPHRVAATRVLPTKLTEFYV